MEATEDGLLAGLLSFLPLPLLSFAEARLLCQLPRLLGLKVLFQLGLVPIVLGFLLRLCVCTSASRFNEAEEKGRERRGWSVNVHRNQNAGRANEPYRPAHAGATEVV